MVDKDVHVLPVNDLREHEESRDCWCEPRVEADSDWTAALIVHHSLDGRELVE
jgi:hypothetical protein